MPKIVWQGREVEAVDVEFEGLREDWLTYRLSDGSTVKMKVIVSEILRVEGEYDTEGNPVYLIKSANLVLVKSPDSLKRQQ